MRPSGATATSSLTTTPAPDAAASARRLAAAGGQPAVVGVVLGADGQGDPVGQGHRPLAQRGEQRRRGHQQLGPAGEEAVDGGRERGVAPGQLQVADPARAGQQIAGELDRVEAVVAADVLEPGGAVAGRLLEPLDHRLALQLVVGEGRLQRGRVALEGLAERDRVLHGQLGARPDGEVGGVGGVAEQHDVAVVPALAADGDEADPQRPVGQQLVAVQLGGEQVLAERRCSRTRRPGRARPPARSPRCTPR